MMRRRLLAALCLALPIWVEPARPVEVTPVPPEGDAPRSCAFEIGNRYRERLIVNLDAARQMTLIVLGVGLTDYEGRMRISLWIGSTRSVERAFAMSPNSFMVFPDAAAVIARLATGPATLRINAGQDQYVFPLPDAPEAMEDLVACVQEVGQPGAT